MIPTDPRRGVLGLQCVPCGFGQDWPARLSGGGCERPRCGASLLEVGVTSQFGVAVALARSASQVEHSPQNATTG